MKTRLALSTFVLGVAIPILAAHSQPPVPDATLAAAWNFQNAVVVAADASPYHHSATAVGANPISWGWLNSGVNLSGGKHYSVPNSPVLNRFNGDFTVSAFVRLTTTATLKTIIDNRGSTGGYLFGIAQGKRVLMRPERSIRKAAYVSPASAPMALNRWHHVAASVARSSAQISFYIDGQLVGAMDMGDELYPNTDTALLIGGNHQGTNLFNDRLDEVKIYNRALTDADIATLATSGTPLYEPAPWNGAAFISRNNCYNYAGNKRTNTFAQPGAASGQTAGAISCAQIHQAAVRDGLEPIDDPYQPSLKTSVALVVNPGTDFHWYRLDRYGGWSHKIGESPASNLDNSLSPISDPETADRGDYSDFCGYFRLWSDSQQVLGREQIL